MLWKCGCGEINIGLAKECRNCGKPFSPEFICNNDNKKNNDDVLINDDTLKEAEETNKVKKRDSFGFFDAFKVFLLLILFEAVLDVFISVITKFSYSKVQLTRMFGSDSFFDIFGTPDKFGSPKTISGMMHDFFYSIYMIYLLWHFTCRKYGKSVKKIFGFKKIDKKTIKESLFIGFLLAVTNISISTMYNEVPSALDDYMKSNAFVIYFSITAILFAPIVEEIIFRGVLYNFILKRSNIIFTIIFVGFLFGINHLPQLYPNYLPVIVDIFVGMVLTYLRYKKDSLYAPILTHFALNFTVILSAHFLGSNF